MNVYNKFIRDYIFYLFHITFPSSTRRATCNRKWDWSKDVISIHVPTKGATAYQSWRRNRIRHFNPRSHEGSDDNSNITSRLSLHFNPRSHEGSDLCLRWYQLRVCHFNPRSHEGSDNFTTANLLLKQISIHAPTKGATKAMMDNFGISGISIHAPTKGATSCFSFSITWKGFQSTLPRRERRRTGAVFILFKNFNPRSHEGSDPSPRHSVRDQTEFQSTLPRRERQWCWLIVVNITKFQSTLPRRERLP